MLGDSSTTVLAPPPPTSTASASSSGGGGGEPPPSQPPGITEEDKGGGIRGGDEGGGSGGDRSFGGGKRWPRQETLALLKIRSDMDVAFRDASLKGPLWEEVSRKLAELGYNRSAKKCKEKFENVYKYHKRTKEGRTGKQEGKTYRFFDQLEAFETHSSSILLSSSPTLALPPPPTPPTTKPQAPAAAAVPSMPASNPLPNTLLGASHFSTVLSAAAAMAASTTTMAAVAAAALPQGIASSQTMNLIVPSFSPSINPTALPPSQATNNPTVIPANVTSSFPSFSPDLISNSTSSSTSSDVEIQGRHRRKRKWKDFFERLMTEVVQKQEEMQKRFLEAIEKREHERMVREETWRMQELARINREREILAQERSIAAAKDAAVMAFLQKLSEQQNPGQAQPQQNNPPPTSQPQPPPPQAAPPSPLPAPIPAASAPAPATTSQLVLAPVPALPQPLMTASTIDTLKSGNGDHQNFLPTSSSRWPKEEIQALINLRTNLDSKYQENTPKGPLWEEISAGMRKLGYNRNAKRCKEKWENINKYFKKVKESNKKRPEDSKTCPYFHQLDALYKERNKNNDVIDIGGGVSSSNLHFKPENSVPLMVMPEQQWPPAGQEHRPGSVMEDLAAEDHQDDDDDDKDNEDDDEDEAGGYEIVANKSASISTV